MGGWLGLVGLHPTIRSAWPGLHTIANIARLHNSGSRLQGRLVKDDFCISGASQPEVNCQKSKLESYKKLVSVESSQGGAMLRHNSFLVLLPLLQVLFSNQTFVCKHLISP